MSSLVPVYEDPLKHENKHECRTTAYDTETGSALESGFSV
jgi:hypothetical protein